MQLVEQIFVKDHKTDFKTRYIKYRAGRLKHQYWLWNRHRKDKIVDSYDAMILKNCCPGHIAFFSSAGYYLKDIWPAIDSIETHSVVKEFYPSTLLVSNRQNLSVELDRKYDNFAIVNNRADHWVNLDGLTQHLVNYTKVLNSGARLFYSFRDTQIQFNRLIVDHRAYFLNWAKSLAVVGLDLVWHDIKFAIKEKDNNGNYDGLENPDSVNGNLKFWFVYKGKVWNPIIT
jgi:hypothetical protein